MYPYEKLRSANVLGTLTAVELAQREAERQKEAVGLELRRGMGVLASVGSVAPFVGLLGTVVGIITAFQGIATTGSGGLGAVSAGIAEALIETALGLCVAIPAVLLVLALGLSGVRLGLERLLCVDAARAGARAAARGDTAASVRAASVWCPG